MNELKPGIDYTKSSGNVFADSGLPDADMRQAKADLARRIRGIVRERGLTQAQAGEILDLRQPKVSALMRGLLSGFSLERLVSLLKAFEHSVEIVVMPANAMPGRITASTLADFVTRNTVQIAAVQVDNTGAAETSAVSIYDIVTASPHTQVPGAVGIYINRPHYGWANALSQIASLNLTNAFDSIEVAHAARVDIAKMTSAFADKSIILPGGLNIDATSGIRLSAISYQSSLYGTAEEEVIEQEERLPPKRNLRILEPAA